MRLALAISATLFAAACRDASSAAPDLGPPPTEVQPASSGDAPPTPLNPRLMRRFPPLAPAPPASATMVDLGRMLFYDTRLSKAKDVSCNSCHALDQYGVDHRKTSIGHAQQRGRRNAPSVYHAAGQIAEFWDGRSPDVVDQAGQPITDPVEMAMQDSPHVVAVVRAIPGYVEAFRAAYPGDPQPVTFAHLTAAIGAFEGGLLTPAPWDRYLTGDHHALSDEQIEGFRLFADIGCVECHTGERLGGSSFQKAGRVRPWGDQHDRGRWEVTHADADDMVFKVPSLRNVDRTGPYFHDGSVATLDEAVTSMASHQLGVDLDRREVTLITAWLHSLTGALPEGYIAEPALPPDPIAAR